MVTDDFKQQFREIWAESGQSSIRELADEILLALSNERPCDRADSIAFVENQAASARLTTILTDHYEEVDGDLLLPDEAEARAWEDDIARSYD